MTVLELKDKFINLKKSVVERNEYNCKQVPSELMIATLNAFISRIVHFQVYHRNTELDNNIRAFVGTLNDETTFAFNHICNVHGIRL